MLGHLAFSLFVALCCLLHEAQLFLNRIVASIRAFSATKVDECLRLFAHRPDRPHVEGIVGLERGRENILQRK